jgi:hypothetical protein
MRPTFLFAVPRIVPQVAHFNDVDYYARTIDGVGMCEPNVLPPPSNNKCSPTNERPPFAYANFENGYFIHCFCKIEYVVLVFVRNNVNIYQVLIKQQIFIVPRGMYSLRERTYVRLDSDGRVPAAKVHTHLTVFRKHTAHIQFDVTVAGRKPKLPLIYLATSAISTARFTPPPSKKPPRCITLYEPHLKPQQATIFIFGFLERSVL